MSDKTEYPPNHKVGMIVPVGGSDCAKCEYWAGVECANKYFKKWNNDSGRIPVTPDKYCCDFWMPTKK